MLNLLFCAHTLHMNYIINMFLLVSSSIQGKQLLCSVHGQGQKSKQRHTTKNFVRFHNHSPLLIMMSISWFLANKLIEEDLKVNSGSLDQEAFKVKILKSINL